MDSFPELIKRSWKNLRSKYFLNVMVVFLVSIFVSGYAFSSNGNNTSVGRSLGNDAAGTIEEIVEMQSSLETDAQTTGMKYTKGVMSVFVNQTNDSGSLFFGIVNGINTLVFKGMFARSVTIFVVVVLMFLFLIFIKNIVNVGMCRFFLEKRRYTRTKADKLLFVYKYGKTRNVAKVMLIRYIFQFLWNLTIIGGVIKRYEYRMIPYILAENPEIEWKTAFRISKQMTRGDKWKLFLADVVFIFAYILNSFTFNLLATFFVDPFRECFYAEVYMSLRARKYALIDDYARLKDTNLATDKVFDSDYPDYAYFIEPLEKRKWINIDYDRKYTFITCVLFFFSFSFVGYVWEVFYTLLNEGVLANRGTMHGPWLPIYGVGGVLIIFGLRPLRKNPWLMFFGAFTVCGILEYFTAWILETLFDTKWWDYTGYFLNIHGRICLEGLFVFGLAGIGFTYIFAPLLDNLYRKIRPDVRKILCISLGVLFVLDLIWSALSPNTGSGVTYEEKIPAVEAEAEVDT